MVFLIDLLVQAEEIVVWPGVYLPNLPEGENKADSGKTQPYIIQTIQTNFPLREGQQYLSIYILHIFDEQPQIDKIMKA